MQVAIGLVLPILGLGLMLAARPARAGGVSGGLLVVYSAARLAFIALDLIMIVVGP